MNGAFDVVARDVSRKAAREYGPGRIVTDLAAESELHHVWSMLVDHRPSMTRRLCGGTI